MYFQLTLNKLPFLFKFAEHFFRPNSVLGSTYSVKFYRVLWSTLVYTQICTLELETKKKIH